MKTFLLNSVVTAAAFSLALGASSQVNAEQFSDDFMNSGNDGTQSIKIQYARGELATDGGLDVLHGKIKRAAAEICGPTGLREAGGLTNASRNRKCYDDALSAAVSQLGSDGMASLGY